MLGITVFSFGYSPQDRSEGSSGDADETGIDSGGIISENETLCGPGTAHPIENISSPSGDIVGFILIKWEYKLDGGTWTEIPGESSLTFSPGFVTERTEFRRGCREEIGQPWVYSNIIVKDVVPNITDVKVISLDVTCKNGNDGYGGAQVIGGTPGYSFEWSSGHSTGSVFDFTAGEYTVTVTDQNGCTFTSDEFEIREPAELVTINEIGNFEALCHGSADGALIVEAEFGEPPYSFTWSNGNTTPYNYDLPAGTYDVSVIDAKGCMNILTGLTVSEPARIEVESNEKPVSCASYADGEATIEISGGTAPYFQIWNDGEIAPFRNDLEVGIYEVAIMDANGCSYSESVEIIEPNPISISPYVVNNIICKASINVVPDGGTAPYTFSWDTGETESFLSNLCPGEYSLTLLDANLCEFTETLTITADYAIESIKIEMILNPYSVTDEIVIKVPYKTPVLLEIYTATGQLVESFEEVIPTEDKEIHFQLDLAKYANGTYLVRIEQNGLTASDKIVIAN